MGTADPYLRLQTAPPLVHPGHPICGACEVEVSIEDDWICDSCGTVWPADSMEDDGSRATLYPDWSGEELTGPICRNDKAWLAAGYPAGEWSERCPDAVLATPEEDRRG